MSSCKYMLTEMQFLENELKFKKIFTSIMYKTLLSL